MQLMHENQNLYSKTLNFIKVPGMHVSPQNYTKTIKLLDSRDQLHEPIQL